MGAALLAGAASGVGTSSLGVEAQRACGVAPLRFTASVGDSVHDVVVSRQDGAYVVTLNSVEHIVDARKLEADFYSILFEGRSYEVAVESVGSKYVVRHGAHEQVVELADSARSGREELRKKGGVESVDAVMPGKVVRVLVAPADVVQAGQGLVVVEAMKMENEIGAPRAGRVKSVDVSPGQTVETGTRLVVLE
jgi:biotin carboxyl carrier protein